MADGTLFDVTVRRRHAPQHPAAEGLIAAARSFHSAGLTPSYGRGDHGNFSCRTADGFLISGRETSKAALRPGQLVHVVGCEPRGKGVSLICEGLVPPSTDTLMHAMIYRRRPDVAAILHGHDDEVLRQAEAFGLPVTRCSARANSRQVVEEVQALCASHDYVVLRDHGFVAVGSGLDGAVEVAWRWFRAARQSGRASSASI
jgi:ribulose-5-phosphate 4-epimerase/fuculose-1-phosphate aldolase